MTKDDAKVLAEILIAISEGKKIQARDKRKGTDSPWYDVNMDVLETLDAQLYEYRIKQPPTFVPYEHLSEFLKASREHGPYIVKGGIALVPEWRYEKYNGAKICIDNCYLTPRKLLDEWSWGDGSRCGIFIK